MLRVTRQLLIQMLHSRRLILKSFGHSREKHDRGLAFALLHIQQLSVIIHSDFARNEHLRALEVKGAALGLCLADHGRHGCVERRQLFVGVGVGIQLSERLTLLQAIVNVVLSEDFSQAEAGEVFDAVVFHILLHDSSHLHPFLNRLIKRIHLFKRVFSRVFLEDKRRFALDTSPERTGMLPAPVFELHRQGRGPRLLPFGLELIVEGQGTLGPFAVAARFGQVFLPGVLQLINRSKHTATISTNE